MAHTTQTERLLLKPEEFAAAIGVSRAKAYELIAERAVPSIKVGRCRRVPIDSMREWIAQLVTAQE
jgi:excisionase family DNA binding protein